MKSYAEMIRNVSFEDRLKYLYLGGGVGTETFGPHRYLNQKFYNSPEWLRFRNEIIIRDNGCDLAVAGYDIYDKIYIHHIEPVTYDDIVNRSGVLLDPNNVVCVSFKTHNMIHYGIQKELHDENLVKERIPGDTKLW